MFKFLKEKLKDWTQKLSSKAEAVEVKEKPKEQKKTEIKPEQKHEKKPVKEKIKGHDKEVPIPMQFNAGMEQFQPDFEKIKDLNSDLTTEVEIDLEPKPEQKESKGFFQKLAEKMPFNRVVISEQEFEIYSEDLQMLLLENNVAFEVAEKIISELRGKIVGHEFLKKEVEPEIRDALKEIISNILIEPINLIDLIKDKRDGQDKNPYVIVFMGVNGTGKTTTIAKVADFLEKKGLSCILAAGDTFRAAAVDQIKTHGARLGITVIDHGYGSDPASVGYDAIAYAKKNFINCVLIDTAGRMHTAKNLMKEMEKIVKVCKPDLKVFIGESTTGNDSIEQAKSFNWSVGIDGIVLTKADVDEKGGAALSVGYVTKKPILFLGTGQAYNNIEPFNKQKFLEKLGL